MRCAHGEVVDGLCECDEYYVQSSDCSESFRDVTGETAWVVPQVLLCLIHFVLICGCLQQLLSMRSGEGMKAVNMLLLVVGGALRLVWLSDPYGFGGTLDATFAALLNNMAGQVVLLALSLTILVWWQMLDSRDPLSTALLRRYLYPMTVAWFVLTAGTSAATVYAALSRAEDLAKLLNTVHAAVSLSQTVLVLTAAWKLKKLIRTMPTLRCETQVRLLNLVHSWTLVGVAAMWLFVSLAAFVALGLEDDPWALYAVLFLGVKCSLVVVMLVLYIANAHTRVPWAQAVMRVLLSAICLWTTPPDRAVASVQPGSSSLCLGAAAPGSSSLAEEWDSPAATASALVQGRPAVPP